MLSVASLSFSVLTFFVSSVLLPDLTLLLASGHGFYSWLLLFAFTIDFSHVFQVGRFLPSVTTITIMKINDNDISCNEQEVKHFVCLVDIVDRGV